MREPTYLEYQTKLLLLESRILLEKVMASIVSLMYYSIIRNYCSGSILLLLKGDFLPATGPTAQNCAAFLHSFSMWGLAQFGTKIQS